MGLHQTEKLLHTRKKNQMKRQPTEWEKNFVNHISNNEVISKIYKELS